MKDDTAKAWKCGNGHVLGLVVRNANGIRQMMLYREAVNLDGVALHSTLAMTDNMTEGKGVASQRTLAMTVEEVDVIAVVEGHVMDVRCSICGRMRTWVPGEEALRRLMERAGREF